MSTTTTKPALADCKPSGAILTGDTWASRVQAFMGSSKYNVLNTRVKNAVNNPLVTIFKLDLPGFRDLMGKFTAPKYNGIRMHFVSYPDDQTTSNLIPLNMQGQLAVFFCPTTEGPAGSKTGIDDTTQFWYLGPSGPAIPLPAPHSVDPADDIVTNWKNHYIHNRKDVLETDGKGHMGKDFRETERLWYSMVTIAGRPGEDVGLLPYLTCQTDPAAVNPIIELYIQLSAFTPMDATNFPEYQLSSVFYFRQASDPVPDPSGLTATDVAHAIVFGSASLPNRVIPADTGIPCPPATSCPGTPPYGKGLSVPV